MTYDFHVHDVLRVEYRVLADGPFLSPGCARIERETRTVGGNGVVAACALSGWGARVLLTGNSIGTDAHGQFLQRELAEVPNLTFEPHIEADLETPYAILLQTADPKVTTLLSARASALKLEPRVKNADATRFFCVSRPDVSTIDTQFLTASSQSYLALLDSLYRAAAAHHNWMGATDDATTSFATTVTQRYKEAFDGIISILSREEMEAIGRAKR